MNLIVSTTIRRVTSKERSGYIYSVNLEEKKVLKRSNIIEPLYREADANPRGGMRGSKGIAIRPDLIALSNTSSIFLYTPDWKHLRTITHPSCAGIHEIIFCGDLILVTASRSDMIFSFDLDGNLVDYIDFRDANSLRNFLKWYPPVQLSKEHVLEGKIDFRDPRTYEMETYDNAHVNSICSLDNGELIVSLGLILESSFLNLLRVKKWLKKRNIWSHFIKVNRIVRRLLRQSKNLHSELVFQPAKGRSAVVRISKEKNILPIIVLEDKVVPSHSLLSLSDRVAIYLDTTNGNVVEFDPETGEIFASTNVTDGFLRGGTSVSEKMIVLGSVGELIIFDLDSRTVQSKIQITDIPQETIFDIQILPTSYELPPYSFNEKLL